MKKNIVALAVASAIAAPVAMADAPTVYGQMNMAIQNNASGDSTGTSVDSIASRLGVKGSSDLGNGLKAVYKVEFGLTPDAGGKDSDGNGTGAMTNRNQYVGLAGGFGTVLMGRHDTPVKMSQPKDLFNDGQGDNKKVSNIGWNTGENRLSNVLAYVSPSFGGVKLVGAAVSAEDGTEDSSLTNIYSVAAMYGSKKEGLYLAAGYEAADDTVAATEDTFTRISAQYKTGGLIANAMYQIHTMDTAGGEDSYNNITASAGYKFGNFMPKVKFSTDGGDNDLEGQYVGVGVNYSLGKKTTAYLEVNSFDDDMAGGDSYTGSALGLLHKF